MHQRYVITLTASGRPLPPALSDDPDHRATFGIDNYRVVIDTPDAPLGHGLRVDRHESVSYTHLDVYKRQAQSAD